MATVVFPQFAVGNGWTTQVTGILPAQPNSGQLAFGAKASIAALVTPGDGATVSQFTPCLGLWEGVNQIAANQFVGQAQSGGASVGTYTGLSTCQSGSTLLTLPTNGLGQGPMQLQVFAPNAQALREGVAQLTYFYQGNGFTWQVTVNAINVLDAKTRWTAPLFQGGNLGNVTSFSVVNMSPVSQSATITLKNNFGNVIGVPKLTPILTGGCGCNQYNQNAPGGFFASTVPDLFGNFTQDGGTIEFRANQPIVVIVLRVIGGSLGSAPAV